MKDNNKNNVNEKCGETKKITYEERMVYLKNFIIFYSHNKSSLFFLYNFIFYK